MTTAAGELDPKSPDFGQKVQEVLSATLVTRDERVIAQGISVLKLLVENDLRPSVGTGLNAFNPESLWLATLELRQGGHGQTLRGPAPARWPSLRGR